MNIAVTYYENLEHNDLIELVSAVDLYQLKTARYRDLPNQEIRIIRGRAYRVHRPALQEAA